MFKKLQFLILFLALFATVFGQFNSGQPTLKFRGYLAANPSACTKTGEYYWNTVTLTTVYCTVTGTPGTWVALSPRDGQGLGVDGLPNFANLGTRTRIEGNMSSTGNNDVYTVPAGFQFLTRAIFYYGQTAGYTVYSGVKIASTYNRLSQITAVGANTSRSDSYAFAYESTEVVFLNTTVANVRYVVDGYLIPNTGINIARPMVTTMVAATDTLLYTVPASTRAFIIPPVTGFGISFSGQIVITNDSGVSGTANSNYVPSGQTNGATFITQQTLAENTGSQAILSLIPPFLSAGDKVYFQSSINNTGQVAYMTIIEVSP